MYEEQNNPKIILFGSIAKAENRKESDIDIYMDTSRREIDLKEAEKTIKRKIELHFKEELTNKNLKNNINQGIVLFE
ncbi:MAG: nucleotidyltransferase domain-containing protein [Nanoarchaeota archaeon]|nr:nucleotidyltransferase domain-containing protein [Nanoarchaeota archaeon]MBU1270028.1 nucleotidyltransferase domain-containing protein [Nanoarchaeota archaeon]MBU1603922.1 nucleotidyltransferase domain-containing protein [Nanoarchaeota archaeon]MBU2442507.1 nucleotidyltransferase domain-containing protein [Nanoarchaeota archaeon]